MLSAVLRSPVGGQRDGVKDERAAAKRVIREASSSGRAWDLYPLAQLIRAKVRTKGGGEETAGRDAGNRPTTALGASLEQRES
jgi:hypothetical protein